MIHAAQMFGSDCRFWDRGELVREWEASDGWTDGLSLISPDELRGDYSPVIALDNVDGAHDVYGFHPPAGPQPAVVAGNERRGITHRVQQLADCAVQIPVASRNLNCLNVAAASAVALYYLTRGGGGKLQERQDPGRRRPELMMLSPEDHIELGSSIRSAGAFGWDRMFVEDRAGIWFGCDRRARSEGRAAARRARNPIRVVPTDRSNLQAFREVTVITTRTTGTPLHRTALAGGPGQLIAIPDEGAMDIDHEDWDRLGKAVRFVRLDLPAREFTYHYRLIVTIALAEVARQVGRKARSAVRTRQHGPVYDSSLALLAEERGETIYLDELELY